MTKQEYQNYLSSNHWKKLRRRALERSQYRCDKCGSSHALEVHHLRYRNLYDVTLDDLETVCSYHHEKAHGIQSGKRPHVFFDREKHERDVQSWMNKKQNRKKLKNLDLPKNSKSKKSIRPEVAAHRRNKEKNNAQANKDRAELAKIMPWIFK